MENSLKKIIFLIYKNPLFLFLTFVFILFWPIIFGKKLLPGFDLLLIFYPYSYHFLNIQSSWASGILNGFGVSTLSSTWAGNWIYYRFFNFGFLDFISFYNVLIFFYFILTTAFSYLASRKIGFDKYVSVLVASVYIFSAYNLSWMVNIVTAASLFIFPAIIYFLLKFKENQNWLWLFYGGLMAGFGLIMSHPQFALIAMLGGFIFSLFLVFESSFKKPKWIFLVAFSAIGLIGFILAAFQLIPEYQSVQLTQRGAALSFQDSQQCALIPLDFVRYFIPNFNFLVSCESLLYVGVLPLILAILAIFYSGIEKKRIFFWIFLLVFSILFSIKHSPLAWVFHKLPIWRSVRSPSHFLMLSDFALAVLAGFGFNWILENKDGIVKLKIFSWFKRIFFGFLVLIISINILGLLKDTFIKWARDYFDKYYYFKTIGLPVEHYHRVIENIISSNFYAFSFLNKEFLIPFILSVSAFLVIIFIKKFNKTSLFYVFIFSGFIWAVSSPMVSSGLRRDFFKEAETAKFLSAQKDNFRIYSLMPGLSAYQLLSSVYPGATLVDESEFLRVMLTPNLNLVYGLNSIDGYDNSMPRRAARLLAELLSERATLGNKIAEARLKPEEKIKIFESRANLLRMMNVKYVISAFPLDEKIFKKVFETKATRFDVPVYVYENKNVLPRFYFAESVKSIESDELAALDQILTPSVDFKTTSFIECNDNCGDNSSGKIIDPVRSQTPKVSADAFAHQTSNGIDYEYKNGYLRLNTKSQTGGWLVFSESYDRGWQAKINDSTVSIYRANYIYQAVKVPARDNIIEFIYKPVFY